MFGLPTGNRFELAKSGNGEEGGKCGKLGHCVQPKPYNTRVFEHHGRNCNNCYDDPANNSLMIFQDSGFSSKKNAVLEIPENEKDCFRRSSHHNTFRRTQFVLFRHVTVTVTTIHVNSRVVPCSVCSAGIVCSFVFQPVQTQL